MYKFLDAMTQLVPCSSIRNTELNLYVYFFILIIYMLALITTQQNNFHIIQMEVEYLF